ncbi:unnamed protein product [Allacma fusca]|uniref:Uncharacterized protein n=1 Tax=Allacma fusca TaxID=39272 RepID=A0A8J2KNS8_9HEXA|nr:unnamed protein product [Allacma fusca]
MDSPATDLTRDSESDSSLKDNGSRGGFHEDYYTDVIEENAETKVRKKRFLDDHMDDVFEPVHLNELKLILLGEIVSAEGFDASPICVHYLFELPKGWRNDSVVSNLQGITNSCYSTTEGMSHFSFSFFTQLIFSLDTVEENETISRPIILISVASMLDSTRVKFDGYGYISLPSNPGTYNFKIQTWKPKPRTIEEKMAECFVDVAPSLQDIRAAHIPYFEGEECRRANRLGLQTEPSGFVTLRFHVFHQVPTDIRAQSSKLILMEKMSSATIVKSVQTFYFMYWETTRKTLKGFERNKLLKEQGLLPSPILNRTELWKSLEETDIPNNKYQGTHSSSTGAYFSLLLTLLHHIHSLNHQHLWEAPCRRKSEQNKSSPWNLDKLTTR